MNRPKKASRKAASSTTSSQTMALAKKSVVQRYHRAVLHMRHQLHPATGRFGLIFGSGIGKPLKFPDWEDLVGAIARHPEINANLEHYRARGGGSQPNVSQRLFQRFKHRRLNPKGASIDIHDKFHSDIQSNWNRIIREALYGKKPAKTETLLDRDVYLKEFLPVIKNTKLTVNYNFDDTLERFMAHNRTPEERKITRGSRTIWSPDVQLWAQNAVIYHPNGFLPSTKSERQSDDVIFLEDSFGDQLINSTAGHYSVLPYHLAQNTCLLIGLSLEDATLKHLLRKSAQHHPGHVHYYVKWTKPGERLSTVQQQEIRDANFEVYNLVTLFLNDEEIAALGSLLSADESEIRSLGDQWGLPSSYYYFLTGSVCAGKSTTVAHFRSLSTHDEWLDPKVEGMERDPRKVSATSKIKEIDEFVVQQWNQKNAVLAAAKAGIHIIDRSPLDAFAFTPENEWKTKAKYTRRKVTPDNLTLVKGMVLLLTGNPSVMAIRATRLQKDVTPELLDYRQALLRRVFEPGKLDGVIEVNTCEKNPAWVAKEVGRIIHLEDYRPLNLSARLAEIISGSLTATDIRVSQPFMLPGTADAIYGQRFKGKKPTRKTTK